MTVGRELVLRLTPMRDIRVQFYLKKRPDSLFDNTPGWDNVPSERYLERFFASSFFALARCLAMATLLLLFIPV